MYATVCMNSRFSGTSRNSLTSQQNMDATPHYEDNASPMPSAVSIFFETPMNGHMPRNFTRIKFSTRIAPKAIEIKPVMLIRTLLIGFFYFLPVQRHCIAAIRQPRVMKPPKGSTINSAVLSAGKILIPAPAGPEFQRRMFRFPKVRG
jgi:hypothetical protein